MLICTKLLVSCERVTSVELSFPESVWIKRRLVNVGQFSLIYILFFPFCLFWYFPFLLTGFCLSWSSGFSPVSESWLGETSYRSNWAVHSQHSPSERDESEANTESSGHFHQLRASHPLLIKQWGFAHQNSVFKINQHCKTHFCFK